MRTAKGALATLAVGLALVMVLTVHAQVIVGGKGPPATFKAGLVAGSKEKEKSVDALLKAFGPALRDQIMSGRQVSIPGVGTFQVVKVDEYKDLVGGRPAVIPARNYVEFVPEAGLNAAANSAGAVPARVVPAPEFKVNPNGAPNTRNEGSRAPRVRIR